MIAFAVFSNSKKPQSRQQDPVVPLMVPFVNTSHLLIILHQQSLLTPRPTRSFIVTNTNCATTGIAVPLAALEHAFGPLDAMLITTMQAVSGAVLYIGGEGDKLVEKGYIKHPQTLSPCRYVSHTQHAARPH